MAWDGWTALPGLRQETAGLCPPCSCSSPYWSLSSILSVCTHQSTEKHTDCTLFSLVALDAPVTQQSTKTHTQDVQELHEVSGEPNHL